jgi:hypothetical protein
MKENRPKHPEVIGKKIFWLFDDTVDPEDDGGETKQL